MKWQNSSLRDKVIEGIDSPKTWNQNSKQCFTIICENVRNINRKVDTTERMHGPNGKQGVESSSE